MTANELRNARKALDVTWEELATGLGISVRTVTGWSAGIRNGKPNEIPRAAALLIRAAVAYPQVRRLMELPEYAKNAPR
jgi:transcriptional regulator with XRE-family HTH domain